jgi:hypothetical protein
MPLLYRQLKKVSAEIVPASFMERLRDYFYLNAARNHLLMEELRAILQLFETAGIRAVPYKGPLLATALYGDAALRQFNDLDIMVRREETERARALLSTRGLKPEQELTETQTAALLKVECEQMFLRREGRIYLDLHWGFVPSYFPIRLDLESIWKRLTSVSTGERRALAFSQEDLLLILSVNAGKESWALLGDLSDIAALIRNARQMDWESLIGQAKKVGASRMLFVSLMLAQDLFGAPLPEKLRQSIAADKEVGRLASLVRQELFSGECEGVRGVARFLKPAKALDGRFAQARFHLRLALTPSPEDWTFIKRPGRLSFLYYLTRPFRLAGKYVLHRQKPVGQD